jgi:pseudouridine kinase
MGFANVIVTDSAGPLHAVSAGARRAFVPPPIEVASVNGAGDAFAAGTIYGLSQGKSLFDAVPLGLAAAALTAESDETVLSDLSPALLAGGIAEAVGS